MKKLSQHIFSETGYTPSSTDKIYMSNKTNVIRYWAYGIGIFLIIFLFLPWTQNISANGNVTTLYQDQRPQQMNSIIAGRIVKWFVREGDFVKKGDTIVQLLDVKDDFLDPKLVERTEEQLFAKQQKIDFYRDKITATQSQVLALEGMRTFKLSALENKMDQLRRKVISDSAELAAAQIDYGIADQQLTRAKKMFSDGIISLVELERRTALFNKSLALLTEKQQKFQNTKQDIVICRMDMNVVQQEAADKIFKARSEIAAAQTERTKTNWLIMSLEGVNVG
jgi:multidrug efflux pump subunit AcrA (membrane-fusion protein)